MAKTSHVVVVVVVTAAVDMVVIYIASMKRSEISNQCVLCCERMTY